MQVLLSLNMRWIDQQRVVTRSHSILKVPQLQVARCEVQVQGERNRQDVLLLPLATPFVAYIGQVLIEDAFVLPILVLILDVPEH